MAVLPAIVMMTTGDKDTSPNTRILIIGRNDDPHVVLVSQYLKDYLVIDPYNVVSGNTLSYSIDNRHVDIEWNGNTINNVQSVWFRKPTPISKVKLNIDPEHVAYSKSILTSFIDQLFVCFQHAIWVSDLHSIRKANNKFLQLQLAKQIGLSIPDTLITSDSVVAASFIDNYEISVVKSFGSDKIPKISGKTSYQFTKKIIKSSDEPLEGLRLSPSIFQSYIKPQYEVRVTVVGDEVFGAKVIPRLDDAHISDWRLEHLQGKIKFSKIDLPKDIINACLELNQLLGLNFSTMDFIVDIHDKIWFLEVNPNGQWGFIEEDTGLPIAETMASFLMSGTRKMA